ncbi:hypothetical protein KCU65_g9605, partial [Aureobasidium melanogenum]
MPSSFLFQEPRELSITDDLISENIALFDRVVVLKGIIAMQLKERNDWKKLAEERAQVINEQGRMINKLEKRIAKMKGPEKIKEEVSVQELEERKDELELAEENKNSKTDDHTAERVASGAVKTVEDP